MVNKLIIIGLILLQVLTTGCVSNSRKVENIRSFAKVYGYVRWFYPGDEAAQVNWNKFAVLGVNKVENARNQKELKEALLELFKPIAPAIQIEDSIHAVNFDLQSIIPNNPTEYKPVSWKHYGVFLGERSNIYQSIRINRDTINGKNICLANSIQDISAYRGKEVKMVASMKSSKEAKGNVYLCLTSIKNIGPDFLYILQRERHIVKPSDKWGEFEAIIKVNYNDNYILYGLDMEEQESLDISEMKIMVRENRTWKPIEQFSIDIEQSNWQKNRFLYDFKIDSSKQKNRKKVVEIISTTLATKIGEFIRKNIGNNLVCIMPLALYGSREHTYPVPDSISFKKLNQQLIKIPDADLNTKYPNVRLANIVIAWNVFQHFYPYFDVVHVDWNKELTNSLKDVYDEKTESDYFKTMCKMISKLADGHGVVYNNNIVQWGLPVSFAWIENNVVISGSKSSLLQRGDIIINIDGRSALEELIAQESLVSGSPQLKRYRALNIFGTDFSRNEANITLSRDDKTLEIKVNRDLRCNLFFNSIGMESSKSKEYAGEIYYENSRQTDFDKELSNLVKARGIIVDPLSDVSKIIPHLIKEPVWSPFWNTPITRYPDRENVTFNSSRWKIDPIKPYISAKIAFIEEPFKVSAGETFLSFIDHYKLGELIGDTTAGTNGNANFITLLGGYSVMWTGMKVLRQDSTQHHLIGYRPDYPVKRTIKAIKENRDEYLEKALEILKN
jgi:hypothetical protein